jgi:two-component system, NtrC family, nitrogen regulation response regulator NtrX
MEEARSGRVDRSLLAAFRGRAIRLPPLRAHSGDIPALAQHFLEREALAAGRVPPAPDAGALRALHAYPWPGNVAELARAMGRALAACAGRRLRAEDLPAEIQAAAGPSPRAAPDLGLGFREAMDLAQREAAREYLSAVLAESGGNVSRAARRAGMLRETLHRMLGKLGLRAEAFRQPSGEGAGRGGTGGEGAPDRDPHSEDTPNRSG